MSTHESSPFARFMASNYGRAIRVGMGAVIIGTGLTVVGGTAGTAMAVFGLLPIATGALNLCPVAPAWGGHFLGAKYCGVKTPAQTPGSNPGDLR